MISAGMILQVLVDFRQNNILLSITIDAGSCVQDSALMLSMCKKVPWFVEDGTGRVNVVGARGATGLVLTVASEIFEESGRSIMRGTLDYLQGLKKHGKREEHDPIEMAASALESQFFSTEPFACDPSSLPKYPPGKEIDVKLRDEAKRQGALGKSQRVERELWGSKDSQAVPLHETKDSNPK